MAVKEVLITIAADNFFHLVLLLGGEGGWIEEDMVLDIILDEEHLP